jgi:hypothetical protein
MCTYLPNSDLINMSLVCRDWNPTCTQHLSTELWIRTAEFFHPILQQYLDNFEGRGQHPHFPTRPNSVKSVSINFDFDTDEEMNMTTDFAILYAVLDHVQHVRRLELHVKLYQMHLDALATVCRDISTHLPNVKHLTLLASLLDDDSDGSYEFDGPTAEQNQEIYACMISGFKVMSLELWDDYPFDGTAVLRTQASTLAVLDLPFPILVTPTTGFCAAVFPHLKRLKLHSLSTHAQDSMGHGKVWHFGTAFPALEYLDMNTDDLYQFAKGGFSNVLYMASSCPRLKYLVLTMPRRLQTHSSTLSITFTHLETLVLHGGLFESHLQLLASIQWPSMTSIQYGSDQVFPNAMLHLLNHAPKLKWFSLHVRSNYALISESERAFDQTEWPNLQGVCIWNENATKYDMFPHHIPAMQKACPNATIHLKFKRGNEYDSRLFYGVYLPPQCGWGCHKCVITSLA